MQHEAFCGRGIPQTLQRGYLAPSSERANLHWVSLQIEGGWRRRNPKVKVLPADVALSSLPRDYHCFTVANLSLAAQQALSLLPFPFPWHHTILLWLRQRCTHVHFFSEANPCFIPSSFLENPCGTQTVWSWYLKLPKKAFSSPKQSMRTHKKPGLFGIIAWLSGKARCHSGHLMSMVQDLPHPAVSGYMEVCFQNCWSLVHIASWLGSHIFWEIEIKKSLSKVVSLLDTHKSRVTVTWDVTGPRNWRTMKN